MLAIEKIVSSFLSFPGLFLLIWGFVVFYLWFKRNDYFIKIVAVLALCLMLFIFSGIGVKVLVLPLENYVESDHYNYLKPYPVVVMGGGIHYGLPERNGELSAISLQRLSRGFQLYQSFNNTDSKIIYSGGVAVGHTSLSEADIAAGWLKEMGVREKDIVKEDQARTTYENGIYINKWVKENDVDRIYLVTSAVHMPRSLAVLQKQGIEAIPVKAGYLYSHQLGWLDYLPNRGALKANLSAIHEWLGLIWYKVKGRI